MNYPNIQLLEILIVDRNDYSAHTKNKPCYLLSCRIDGKGVFFYNNCEHQVKRGDVLYIPKGGTYSQISKKETVITFHFDVDGELNNEIQLHTPKNTDQICHLFLEGLKLWNEKQENYYYLCMSHLYRIMSLLNLNKENSIKSQNDMLNSAMRYINKHLYSQNLSIDKACERACISRAYFNRIFLKEFNTTPIKYINQQRIERAKILLSAREYTNEEISMLCGFNDIKYFYTVFKKHTRMTTKEYCKSCFGL